MPQGKTMRQATAQLSNAVRTCATMLSAHALHARDPSRGGVWPAFPLAVTPGQRQGGAHVRHYYAGRACVSALFCTVPDFVCVCVCVCARARARAFRCVHACFPVCM